MVFPHQVAVCTMCNEGAKLVCSGCNSIHYCSTACQKINWPLHKIVCKDYTQFATARPGLDHHSAIYFGPDEHRPRFIWLGFEPGHNYPTFKDLAQLGVSEDRIKAHAFEEFASNPMLRRHIEPHHILVSLPEAKNLCPCCTTDVEPNNSLVKVDQELASFFRSPPSA